MLNFGIIKETLNDILFTSISKKNTSNRDIFKLYINEVKKNKVLKEQFLVYRNLETIVLGENINSNDYVNENIKILKAIGTSRIIKENKGLLSKLNITVDLDKSYDKKTLHENITELLKLSNSSNNVNKSLELKQAISESISFNTSKVDIPNNLVPNSVLAKVSLDKFNEKYKDLSKTDMLLVKSIVEDDNTKKESLLVEYSNKCINLIDAKFESSDVEIKNKLLKVKNKILNTKFNNETYIKDISNILNLTNKMSNIN